MSDSGAARWACRRFWRRTRGVLHLAHDPVPAGGVEINYGALRTSIRRDLVRIAAAVAVSMAENEDRAAHLIRR